MDNSETKCSHKWDKIGNWDGHTDKLPGGMNIGGPIAKCSICGIRKNFTWEQWEDVDKEKQI